MQRLQPSLLLAVEKTCPEHGPYTAKAVNLTPAGDLGMFDAPVYSRCPVCMANAEAKRAEDERQRESVARKHKIERLLSRSGIPLRFQDRTFANYRTESVGQRIAMAACRGYAENWKQTAERGTSLVMTGGPGTGKTHLACAIAHHVATAEMACAVFVSTTDMLRHIKSTYRKDSARTERQALDDFITEPDLLIVDEIGVQVGSDHEKLLLFEILNERYQWMKPTILISNLNAAELEAYLGHRAMDRYRECGTVIPFDWKSHRGADAS